MLLDLNLPRKDGREVLREMKADPALHDIPVMVLTSSSARADEEYAFALGVERFLHKPISLDEYSAMVWDIIEWWRQRERDAE